MEAHHPHVKEKRFKEYFLELIMIFLAVTLGFFAEALREHIGDRAKEREYLSTMFEELKYDTAQYHTALNKVISLNPAALDSNSFVNFKANNYGYATGLNNAIKIATELLTLIF